MPNSPSHIASQQTSSQHTSSQHTSSQQTSSLLTPGTGAAALLNRLDACARHDAEYGRGLANHLPMLLHALHELGAAPARLDQFAAWYSQQLHAAPLAAPLPHALPALGEAASHGAWLAYFQHSVAALGAEATLRAWLPRLMPGVAAAAFHGLLRTAHGLAAGHAGEVAHGLAYWAYRYMVLVPEAGWPAPGYALADWWQAVAALGQDQHADGWLITGRMQAWAAMPGFAQVAGALRVDGHTLQGIAEVAAGLYAQQGDFTVLHVLTSSWALRVLAPLQPEPELALRPYAAAVAAGWLGSQRSRPHEKIIDLPWPDIAQRALSLNDDHAPKLVHACRQWHGVTGQPIFRHAAARAVHKPPRAA